MAERKSTTRTGVAALTLVLAALVPATAHATDARVSGGALRLDGGALANELVVTSTAFGFLVYDGAEGVRPGAGCRGLSGSQAVCSGFVRGIDVDVGAGDDLVGLWGLEVPVTANGGPGDDLLEGGRGRDTLVGGDGNDTVNGRPGGDRLLGESGDDFLAGSRGRDTLDAGAGDDVLNSGASVDDVLLGGNGRDLLRAGHGDGFLSGGPGADLLVGRGNGDTLDPGPGIDAIVGANPQSDDVDCRAGDAARAQGGGAVPGCERLPGTTTVPEAWPPSGAAAAANLPGGNPDVRITPVKRGIATRFTIWVDASRVGTTTLCIHMYDAGEHGLDHFTKKNVQTKTAKSYQDSRFRRKTYFAIGYKHKCE